MNSVADQTAVLGSSIPSCAVVDLRGEIDLATMPELRSHLIALISSGCVNLVLDAAPLEFIDAVGIGALVRAANLARAAGGWVRLIGLGPRHRRLWSLLRLAEVLPIFQGLEDALYED